MDALTRDDLDACVALYVEAFNAPPWDESWTVADAAQRLGDILDTPGFHGVRSLTSDGALAGFAVGHVERAGAEDHFVLQEMCVRPGLQRQGHGTRMLRALEDRLPGVRTWRLLTARDSAASAFYERNGFRPARVMEVFVRP